MLYPFTEVGNATGARHSLPPTSGTSVGAPETPDAHSGKVRPGGRSLLEGPLGAHRADPAGAVVWCNHPVSAAACFDPNDVIP